MPSPQTPRPRRPAPDPLELLAPLDGRPGPARRLSSAVSSEIVRSVLEKALDATMETPQPVPVAAPRWSSRWGRGILIAAAALLTLSVGSGASAVALRLLHDIELGPPELAPSEPPPSRHAAARPAAPAPAPEPAAPVVEVAPPVVEPAPEPPPPVRTPRKKLRRVITRAAPHPAPAPPAVAPAPVVVVPQNLPPADLLAFANERRKRHEWREADLFYGAVVSRFSGTDAAVVADIASAALHLQHLGDPAGALDTYRRTLAARPTGPLAEEARWGMVESHRALGDTRAEVLALRDFLEHHAGSAFAPAARRRLERLAP
jgi:hypothetical protein